MSSFAEIQPQMHFGIMASNSLIRVTKRVSSTARKTITFCQHDQKMIRLEFYENLTNGLVCFKRKSKPDYGTDVST